jgi:hypothetical protein
MNEELPTTNTELQTNSEELRQRTQELDQTNAFAESVLESVETAVVVIDRLSAITKAGGLVPASSVAPRLIYQTKREHITLLGFAMRRWTECELARRGPVLRSSRVHGAAYGDFERPAQGDPGPGIDWANRMNRVDKNVVPNTACFRRCPQT